MEPGRRTKSARLLFRTVKLLKNHVLNEVSFLVRYYAMFSISVILWLCTVHVGICESFCPSKCNCYYSGFVETKMCLSLCVHLGWLGFRSSEKQSYCQNSCICKENTEM